MIDDRRSFLKALGILLIVPSRVFGGETIVTNMEGVTMVQNQQIIKKATLDNYIDSNIGGWVNNEIMPFLRIPSISTEANNKANTAQIKKAAKYLFDLMREKKMHPELIDGDNPVVYGQIGNDPTKKTLLIYGHFDVQPGSDDDAFNPKIVGDKLYGRGSSDDKGQLLTHIYAIQSYLKTNTELPINIKFLFEGGEENGSEGMEDYIKKNKTKLKADAVLITDSNSEREKIPCITTNLRGIVGVDISLQTMNNPVHSGVYGGPAPNALDLMVALLYGLKNPDNYRINIPEFYDNVRIYTPEERKRLNSLLSSQKDLIKELGIGRLVGEKGFTPAELMYIRPTLDTHIIRGGAESNGIPSHASARISMRTVPNQDPIKIYKDLEKYVKNVAETLGILKINVKNTGVALPFSTDINNPYCKAVANAMITEYDSKGEIDYAYSGGSEPIAVHFHKHLGVPVIINGYGTPDNNAHGVKERISIRSRKGGLVVGMKSNNAIYENIGLIK